MKTKLCTVGISMGDPNGIGPEIVAKCLSHPFIYEYCTPIVYGSHKVFNQVLQRLKIDSIQYNNLNSNAIKPGVFNFKSTQSNFEYSPGNATPEAGLEALQSIDLMLADALDGKLDALVTAPVNKSTINPHKAFSGHTSYIAQAFKAQSPLMILFNNPLRVGLVTEHIPLQQVSQQITQQRIKQKAQTLIQSLKKDFRITKPKIAVLGLNPHAGDSKLLGTEEDEMIAPAIQELMKEGGAIVFGPYAGDSIWDKTHQFDAVLAMYHDQGLAPFKALSFNEGVNFTAGLPLVRTSPDHGTAYDIAAQYKASPTSFMNALFEAIHLTHNRNEQHNLSQNFLPFIEHKRERFRLETRDLQNL